MTGNLSASILARLLTLAIDPASMKLNQAA